MHVPGPHSSDDNLGAIRHWGWSGSSELDTAGPLAQWLLETEAGLTPGIMTGSVLAAMRLRHELISAALVPCIAPRTHVVSLGMTCDVRWTAHRDHCASWTAVASAELLDILERALPASPAAGTWQRVERRVEDPVTAAGTLATGSLVVAEGLAEILPPAALTACLERLRHVADVRVVLDVPGYRLAQNGHPQSVTRGRWYWQPSSFRSALTMARLRAAGWEVEADHWQAGRPDICAADGTVYAEGVEPMRVLRIRPA